MEEGLKGSDLALLAFQEELGYFFRDRGLLQTALCHSSYANEHGAGQSNERLEFLGDSVLGMGVARVLYETRPEASEGELSTARVEFVCRDALHRWAQTLDLDSVLLLGNSLRGSRSPSIYADAMEAVLGAVFLDGGYEMAELVVRRYLFRCDAFLRLRSERDAKTKLQNILQAVDLGLPCYETLSVKGPSHAPLFRVQVRAGGKFWIAEGKSRKTAELEAAAKALKFFEETACDSEGR